MYIVLIGPSGRSRKGTALNMGKAILKGVNIQVTSESVTREALIRAMKRSVENYIDPNTNQPKFHCSLTAISPELSVFLGQNDIRFLADLTDWYDSSDEWTYETKGSGTDHIQGVCFNLLGATAADWLQSILPEEAIGGGFTSRIIFIVEENKGKTIAKPTITPEQARLQEALTEDLERISALVGEMELTEEAENLYASWYEQQELQIKRGRPAIRDPRFTGYVERRPTHIKKLCQILSASRGDDLIVTAGDFDRARKILESAEVKMAKVFGGLGSARYSQLTDRILHYIQTRGEVTRSELLAQYYRDMDVQTLEIISDVLQKMKVVKISHIPDKGEAIYEYIGSGN